MSRPAELDPFLLELFKAELQSHARALENGLAGRVAADTAEPLMRAAHSLKGAARMIGIDQAVALAHAMEDILSAVQHGKHSVTPAEIDVLLAANDVFLRTADLQPEEIPGAFEREAATIARLTADLANPPAPAPAAAPVAPPPPPEALADKTYDPFLLDLFRTELQNNARALENGLSAAVTAETAEPLMRAAHSLKGAARMTGLDSVVGLAHAMEDILSAVQNGKRTLHDSEIDLLLRANDVFTRAADVPASDIPAAFAMSAAEMRTLVEELGRAPAPAEPAKTYDPFLLDLFRTELQNNARALENGLSAAVTAETAEPLMRAAHSLKGAARMAGLDIIVGLTHSMEDILSAVQNGKRTIHDPEIDLLLRANDVFTRAAALPAPEIPGSFEASADEIRTLVAELGRPPAAAAIAPVAAPAPAPAPVAAAKPAPAPEKADSGSVRVFVENLNRLGGLASECLVQTQNLEPLTQSLLRIKRNHLAVQTSVERALQALTTESFSDAEAQLQEALRELERIHDYIPEHIADFGRFSQRLEAISTRLYDQSVAMRMRPFADGLHGFPRLVRDVAKSLGKSVVFTIEGDSTRVDRDILEALEAPLNHLLRNALDHGLESPEQRVAAGKTAEGHLLLHACHAGGMLEVRITDDGGGIDLARLRDKVVQKGLSPREMVDSLSEAELLEFLFLPGFSTTDKVTEISGRGVGLDVVLTVVRKVGGNIRIQTQRGKGTTFLIQLPLTLSVLRALLIEIGGEPYAIPLARIDRVLEVQAADIRLLEDRQYFRFGDTTLGLLDAQQVLQLPRSDRPGSAIPIIVLSDRMNRYGLAVDRFLGERDVVVTPLDPRLGKPPNVSAASILDNGMPVLILDTDDLVQSIDKLLGAGSLRKVGLAGRAEKRGRKRVLVVDDSLTVREVERRLLENRGYKVAVAVDGMDGWNTLQSGEFDLVVSDVDMPRMNGIELVRRIKGNPRSAAIPVIIVSYKDQEEHRLLGLEAGASYYLAKSSFHDETLARAVLDLIGEAERSCG
jgi:two-component system, chemotaxis family, sensor histidine kinase and response regulator WspE